MIDDNQWNSVQIASGQMPFFSIIFSIIFQLQVWLVEKFTRFEKINTVSLHVKAIFEGIACESIYHRLTYMYKMYS
jgi:hypothetical protein